MRTLAPVEAEMEEVKEEVEEEVKEEAEMEGAGGGGGGRWPSVVVRGGVESTPFNSLTSF